MKTITYPLLYRYHGPASGLSVSVRKPGQDPVLFETLLHDGKTYELPADVAETDEVKVLVELKHLELVAEPATVAAPATELAKTKSNAANAANAAKAA